MPEYRQLLPGDKAQLVERLKSLAEAQPGGRSEEWVQDAIDSWLEDHRKHHPWILTYGGQVGIQGVVNVEMHDEFQASITGMRYFRKDRSLDQKWLRLCMHAFNDVVSSNPRLPILARGLIASDNLRLLNFIARNPFFRYGLYWETETILQTLEGAVPSVAKLEIALKKIGQRYSSVVQIPVEHADEYWEQHIQFMSDDDERRRTVFRPRAYDYNGLKGFPPENGNECAGYLVDGWTVRWFTKSVFDRLVADGRAYGLHVGSDASPGSVVAMCGVPSRKAYIRASPVYQIPFSSGTSATAISILILAAMRRHSEYLVDVSEINGPLQVMSSRNIFSKVNFKLFNNGFRPDRWYQDIVVRMVLSKDVFSEAFAKLSTRT